MLWLSDPSVRESLKSRAANDFVWWANHFAFAHNEHERASERVRPVYLWPIQVQIAEEIIKNVFRCNEGRDERWNAYGDKARFMGWTFLTLLIYQWLWQYHGISTILTSKTIEDVDTQGNMNTPFEKLRWQIETQYAQAPWMFPDRFSIEDKEHYKTCLISVPGGGPQIAGASKGKDLRQARALIWGGDEFPHTDNDEQLWDASSATFKVRIVGGTPNRERGKNCKAYKLRYNKTGENCRIFTLPWYEHPEHGQGLYRKSDGSLSSPWFDKLCANENKITIATEYLMDWEAAMGKLPLHAFREECCVPGLQPDMSGGPIYVSWDPGKHFGVKWVQPDRYGRLRDFRELYLTFNDIVDGKTLLDVIAERVKAINESFYKHFDIVHVGDPYASRTQLSSQEDSEYDLLQRKHGIRVQSAYMYQIAAEERKKRRHNVLNDLMGTDVLTDEGKITPMYLIDPQACPLTYEAIKQGYRWKVLRDGTETDDVAHSHPDTEMIDTLGMAALKATKNERAGHKAFGPPPAKKEKARQPWRRTGTGDRSYYA
jgi:hypothetical protein